MSWIRNVAAVALLIGAAAAQAADPPAAYRVDIDDASGKVGQHAVLRVVLHPRDGIRILSAYNNRVIELSSFDGQVAFERKVVPAALEDGALVFAIGVTPTAPGRHAINGVLRVGYIDGPQEMAMVSLPLIASVTGTE
ncbi:MAG TPA: hypothetical protein VJY39_00975 [Acidisphaera sp.]|nr:hypothetical protein [Acidisphaera sp.]